MTQETTIQRLNELCKKERELEAKKKELKEQLALVNADQGKLQKEIILIMDTNELENHRIKDVGLFYIKNNFSVPVPKGDAKHEFFNWLKERGMFEDMATINSNTLKAFYKEELAKAIEEGNLNFSIPGLSEPSNYQSIAFRKG